MKISPAEWLLCSISLLLTSCATYMTPDRAADLSRFSSSTIAESFRSQPEIHFPANLAVVRVQGSNIENHRNIETQADLDSIGKNRRISQVTAINSLLISVNNQQDLLTSIRNAAATLKADAILIYTLDTSVSGNNVFPPLTVISLGLAPNFHYRIHSVASAILVDTRTGFVYGTLSGEQQKENFTVAIASATAMEESQRQAEQTAFRELVQNFTSFWDHIVARYDR